MTIAVFILDIIGIIIFAFIIHLLDLMLKRTGETVGFTFKWKHIPYLTLLGLIGILIAAPYFKRDFINAFEYENYWQQIVIIWSLIGINLLYLIIKKNRNGNNRRNK